MKRLTNDKKLKWINNRRNPDKIWTKEDFLNCKVAILRESFDETEAIANFFKELYPWMKYYPRNHESHELGYNVDPYSVYFDRGASFSDRERSPYQAYHFEFEDFIYPEWVSIRNLQK